MAKKNKHGLHFTSEERLVVVFVVYFTDLFPTAVQSNADGPLNDIREPLVSQSCCRQLVGSFFGICPGFS